MSKQLHVGNQQFFRQYAPDSELPLESRIFTTEYEQGNRQRGGGNTATEADFTSPLDFNISMNNELYFLRSLHLRLPITASFVDEYGNSVRSPEEVSSFALRNRADRAFRKVECNSTASAQREFQTTLLGRNTWSLTTSMVSTYLLKVFPSTLCS